MIDFRLLLLLLAGAAVAVLAGDVGSEPVETRRPAR
jgi:hypothetical protein